MNGTMIPPLWPHHMLVGPPLTQKSAHLASRIIDTVLTPTRPRVILVDIERRHHLLRSYLDACDECPVTFHLIDELNDVPAMLDIEANVTMIQLADSLREAEHVSSLLMIMESIKRTLESQSPLEVRPTLVVIDNIQASILHPQFQQALRNAFCQWDVFGASLQVSTYQITDVKKMGFNQCHSLTWLLFKVNEQINADLARVRGLTLFESGLLKDMIGSHSVVTLTKDYVGRVSRPPRLLATALSEVDMEVVREREQYMQQHETDALTAALALAEQWRQEDVL